LSEEKALGTRLLLQDFGMSEDIAKPKTPPFFILKGLSNKLNLVLTS